jgi:hypothetical protein
MKTVSANYLPYGLFFIERKNRIMAFLDVTDSDRLNPADIVQEDAKDLKSKGAEAPKDEAPPEQSEEKKEDDVPEEEKQRRSAVESEKKILDRGLQALESLFPEAGWDRLPSCREIIK